MTAQNAGILTLASPYPFAETVELLKSAITKKGVKLFGVIDQQAEALAVGLTMQPTTLILFGNPKAGTPLMLAQPAAGLDLPMKALVSETTPGTVTVTLNSADYLMQRHALPAELLPNIAAADQIIIESLTK